MSLRDRLALYTTIYPGAERFLRPWLRSVAAQTDRGFDLWIGLDQLSPDQAVAALGEDFRAVWSPAGPGMSRVQLRVQAIGRMAERYPAVVFVDCDDLLAPERIALARSALEHWDVAACAMRVIDQHGRETGVVFPPAVPNGPWEQLLAHGNIFGTGNSAYRSATLRACLPVPDTCAVLDWFLITRACACGARLGFDPARAMAYRQYGVNFTPILPPFSEAYLLRAADLVLRHYAVALEHIPELRGMQRRAVEQARERAEQFRAAVLARPDLRRRYVAELNRLPPRHIWWQCVAHPALDRLWRA
ncbi:MAG TPA: hypothetical protein VFS21_06275 [Roseiflexaceae bacterium]|nr:hypothetical protein [Roseiflexaceae bacterium]